jgi:hypothetical protein
MRIEATSEGATMSLERAQALVAAFHKKFGVPAPERPEDSAAVDWDAHSRRRRWVDSELTEHMEAEIARDVAGLADAYVDVLVFALGGLVELGIDGGPLFDAVMAANMTKVKLPGVAKIAKPPGFVHPDIGALIEAQRKRR